MKKLLVILLALVLCLGIFVACDKNKTDEPETPVVYDVNAAASYVHNLYKNLTTMTGDLEVTSKVVIQGATYTVEWAATEGATITKKNDNVYIVDVNETTETEYTFTLTATVKAPDGTTAVKTFNMTVPAYAVISFTEYMAAEADAVVTIKGIVAEINSKSKNNKYNHLFLVDESGVGGYYCYSLAKDPIADSHVEIGMTVEVTGTIAPYSGMQELKGGTVKIVDSTKKQVPVLDITTQFSAGESMKNYVGQIVTIKGVEIGGQDLSTANSQYLYFKLNGNNAYVRTYVSDFPSAFTLTKEGDSFLCADKATMDAFHAEKYGWNADVTGICVLYNSALYLIPISNTPFTNLSFVDKTPAEKIDIELAELELPTVVGADKVIDIAAAGKYYSNVALTWASDNAAIVVSEGKLTITMPTTATTVTITVTATCDGVTDTKTFEIALTPNTFKLFENTGYYFGFDANGTMKYLDGTTQSNANYRWNITANAADAMVFFVENTEGGYYIYFLAGGETKTYLNIVKNGNYTNLLADAEPKSVWTYDAALNAMVVNVDGTIYTPKNYNNYGNVEAKTSDYTNNATYAACLMAIPFNYAFVNDSNEMKYLDGTTASGANYRWNLTSNAADAAKFYVEGNADGTYYIYFFVAGEKTYLNIVKNGNYTNLLAGNEPLSKWSYDNDLGGFVVEVEGTKYIPKNYNGYNNVEAKTADYTNNVTYVLSLYEVGYVPETSTPEGGEGGEVTPEGGQTPEGGDTPPAGGETPEGGTTEGTLAVGVNYYLAGVNANGALYAKNSITSGRLNASATITEAAVWQLEAGDNAGEYYIFTMVSGAKKYLAVNKNASTKTAAFVLNSDKTAVCVWLVDATAKTIISKDFANRCIGTQNTSTYNNFSTYSTSNYPGGSNYQAIYEYVWFEIAE